MQSLAVSFLLCSSLFAQKTAIPNLEFQNGALGGWEGEGFAISRMDDVVRPGFWVSSRDFAGKGRKAMLHRAFVVPAGAGFLRFWAYAARSPGSKPDERLNVLLLTAGKRVLPKQVRAANGNWVPAPGLLPAKDGQPQEYVWQVSAYAGQSVRIVLLDEDDRPGCYVFCSGFQILAGDEFEVRDFTQFMVRLSQQHHLAPMLRYESPHFLALSNAEESFSETRLNNCEMLYTLFWDHFRSKGFAFQPPRAKFMVAMFDTQAGFNAYLGRKESPLLVGMYHALTNRLVFYDYGQNEALLSRKQQAERQARQITSQLERQRSLEAVQRRVDDVRTGANIMTIMHEAAHQLSFNCGLLNRNGDVPFWLAEGLACYCEATEDGSWQGLGASNPQRLKALANALANKSKLLPLTDLITRDDWLPPTRDDQTALLAYAQSWALFRLLMEEQPQKLRSYLKLIYPRQVSERRMADFQQSFGHDLFQLRRRYDAYIREMLHQQGQLSR
ncbi:MAG TPA: DUF1570 domain-containing protein [Gemmataceae bacterium]|nr:DUF1570 domain-containing protein [Gemmataceae bacterium]